MFGVSFLEIAVVALVALVVVGPQKLPSMMRTAGEWVGKLRRITSDMRAQTGIDDILREEGIDGVAELRTLLRGQFSHQRPSHSSNASWGSYTEEPDPLIEFPVEGADAAGALPDDLVRPEGEPQQTSHIANTMNSPVSGVPHDENSERSPTSPSAASTSSPTSTDSPGDAAEQK